MQDVQRNSSPRLTLAALTLPMLLSSLGTSVTNVALPTLARAFGASFHAIQWVVLAYLLGVTTMIAGVGTLGDTIGRRRLLLSGIALFTLASIICASATNLPVLVAGRALQGLAGAVMMALSLALVSQSVASNRIGSAMGLLGSMSAFGTALGPSLGGMLVAQLGWRSIFLLNVPLGLVSFVLVHRHVTADVTSSVSRRFDIRRSILLAATLGAYALTMTLARGVWIAAGLLATALGGILHWRMRDRDAYEGLRSAFIANALVSTVMMATLVVGPFYLSRALGLAPSLVGLAMSAGPLVTALVGVPAGRLVDRIGAARMTTLGLIAIAVGAILIATLPTRFGVIGYVAPLMIATAGYSTFQTANNSRVMARARDERRGAVSGLLSLARNLGLITGASAMGAVFALGARAKDITSAAPAAVVAGMRLTFAVAAALILVAIALVYLAGRRFGAARFATDAGEVLCDSI